MAMVLVLFHSQEYGHTGAMAGAVAQGASDEGAEVKLVNTNDDRLDMATYRRADAVAFGSPDYYSYLAGGMKMFLDDWHIAKKSDPDNLTDKPYALFYSHGGGGAVVEPLEKLFARMGEQVGKTAESVGSPDDSAMAKCRELGRLLAKAVSD